ncbi:hypothetical protein MKX03_026418 [Papaver bracteatum]|nr:hypothetical protein MKX03_026418 [Papaver bracteatum]
MLLNQDKFIRVREKVCDKTPFGDLLQMDHKPSNQKCVARKAVNARNVESGKLFIENEEYEIDSKLVKKSLSLSIIGDKIVKPRNENQVPIFIEKAIPQLRKDNRKFHLQVIATFQSKDVEVIEQLEVVKLSKLYIALFFFALLFLKHQRFPLEYLYLLDDDYRFENLKLYKFDIEVAKFLKEGIVPAKKAKSRSVTVSGCLYKI